jgi:hypothetical protein
MPAATPTNAFVNMLRDALRAGTSSEEITWVAVGTSSTAPAATDTQLGAEVFRKVMTTDAAGAAAGEGLFTLYLAPGDAVGVVIAEVGWFAGPSAGSGANTGVLVARALYSHTKVITESINLLFDLTL